MPWHTIEFIVGDDTRSILDELLQLAPSVLAASFYLFNRAALLSVIRDYKQIAPQCRVIAGGPEFLGDNREFLESEPCIDIVVRGEGERAFADLLRSPTSPQDVQGACCLVDGEYSDNGHAEVVQELDTIPTPYSLQLASFEKPFVQLETSRGCANACTFCTSGHRGAVRYFSTDRVRADLEVIRSSGVDSIRIVDRTFNENERRCCELLRMFRTEFEDLNFHLEMNPAQLAEAIHEELSRASEGQFHLEVGIQSLDQQVLQDVGRHGSVVDALAGLHRLCDTATVDVHVDLIAGLPGGTLNGLLDDLAHLVSCRPTEIQLETLKLLPGTQLAQCRARWGIVASEEPPYRVIRTATMPEGDMLVAQQLSKVVDWFYQPPALQDVVVQASCILPAFWRELCAFCSMKTDLGMRPALMERFVMLSEFLGSESTELRHALQYAWMRTGFSPSKGICNATRLRGPVPGDAMLVEGNKDAALARMDVIDLDQRYLFGYGKRSISQAAVVIYRLD